MKNLTAWKFVKDIGVGWNIGNSLDAFGKEGLDSEISWGNSPISRALIDSVCNAGFDLIRIPTTWCNHISGENCTIDKAWLSRVKEVVDYTYNKGVYVILNTHHEDWFFTSEENYSKASHTLKCIWQQLSAEFESYGERLIFEGLNEPRKFQCPDEWTGSDSAAREIVNRLNADFVSTVRQSGGNNALRQLMIATYCGCCTEDVMRELAIPEDDKIIVTVHSYQPWFFCAIDGKDPACIREFKEDDKVFTNHIDETFDFMKKYCTDKKIPIIIGEFGAVDRGNTTQRVKYIRYFKKLADKQGIKYVWWDNGYPQSFGLFDRKTAEPLYRELIEELTKKA